MGLIWAIRTHSGMHLTHIRPKLCLFINFMGVLDPGTHPNGSGAKFCSGMMPSDIKKSILKQNQYKNWHQVPGTRSGTKAVPCLPGPATTCLPAPATTCLPGPATTTTRLRRAGDASRRHCCCWTRQACCCRNRQTCFCWTRQTCSLAWGSGGSGGRGR